MNSIDIQVLNGEQAGLQLSLKAGTYRIIRRSAENFDLRSTLVSSSTEQWRLSQEDMELAAANLARRATETGEAVVGIDAYERADDLPIWDQRMSQPHAILLCDAERAQVVDMGSRNGTHLNGEHVGAAILGDGDLLRCGMTRLKINLR